MKHTGFEIKVSDILNSKVTDTVEFENKMIPELQSLSEEGVSGTVTLQSLDQDSLFVSLDLECDLNEICDRCGAEYQRHVVIEHYTAKYVASIDESVRDDEEDILLIDMKNGVIDVEELIYHAIQLEEPFVKYCDECKKNKENEVSDEEDDEWEY